MSHERAAKAQKDGFLFFQDVPNVSFVLELGAVYAMVTSLPKF